MAIKTFEAKVYVQGTPSPVPISVQAQNIPEARRIIESQYGPRFKRYTMAPREVKK